MLAPPQPLGPGPLLDASGVLQPQAVVLDSNHVPAYAPLHGGSAYSSSSADPPACAYTPQVSNYEEPLGIRQCAGGCVCPACWTTTHLFPRAACACCTCSLYEYTPYLSLPTQGDGRSLFLLLQYCMGTILTCQRCGLRLVGFHTTGAWCAGPSSGAGRTARAGPVRCPAATSCCGGHHLHAGVCPSPWRPQQQQRRPHRLCTHTTGKSAFRPTENLWHKLKLRRCACLPC